MLTLVRSGLLRMIACVVVFLPLCILVARVYTPYSSRQGPNECDNWSAVKQPVEHSPEQSANQLSIAQCHCVEEARVRHEGHEGQHGNCAGWPIKQASKP
jgi:hypothetical protein